MIFIRNKKLNINFGFSAPCAIDAFITQDPLEIYQTVPNTVPIVISSTPMVN